MPSVLFSDPTLAFGAVGSVMMWLGVLLAAVLVGGFGLLIIRRRLLDAGIDAGQSGFDLRSLRQMRDRGEISDDEYEVARAGIIGAVSGNRSGASPSPVRTAPKPIQTPETGDSRHAPPGFDLTGEPLPDFDTPETDDAEGEQRPEN